MDGYYLETYGSNKIHKHRAKQLHGHARIYPMAFFDGVSMNLDCGNVGALHLSDSHRYKLFWNNGRGTNQKVELLAL